MLLKFFDSAISQFNVPLLFPFNHLNFFFPSLLKYYNIVIVICSCICRIQGWKIGIRLCPMAAGQALLC